MGDSSKECEWCFKPVTNNDYIIYDGFCRPCFLIAQSMVHDAKKRKTGIVCQYYDHCKNDANLKKGCGLYCDDCRPIYDVKAILEGEDVQVVDEELVKTDESFTKGLLLALEIV